MIYYNFTILSNRFKCTTTKEDFIMDYVNVLWWIAPVASILALIVARLFFKQMMKLLQFK